MQNRNSSKNMDGGESEIHLGDLFWAIWRVRAWAIGGLLVALAVASALVILNHYLRLATTTYSQEIAFKIGGQSAAQYPNGTEFSSNDLRSPVVLNRVYEQTQLQKFGLSYQDFVTSINVTPSSAIYEGVVGRYRARLADNSLTFEERRQVEAEFSAAIASSISSGATINFNVVGNTVPQTVGLAVVAAIPNTWADIYINQLGVLNLPIAQSSNQLLAPGFLDRLDYPAAYDVLEASFITVRSRIDQLKSIAGSQTLADGDNERTIFDIEREVQRLERFSLEQVLAPLTELGLNKTPELTSVTYQFKLDELDRQIRLANDNARIITQALHTATTTAPPSTGIGMAAENRQLSGTVVQQFGPELVDRLIGMSVENAGVGFRETLIQTKLDYEQRALELSGQHEKISRRLALIRGERQIQDAAALEQIFTNEARDLTASLNRQWTALNSILNQVNMERINFDKQLFQPLPTLDQVSQVGSLSLRSLGITLGMAGFLGLMGGLLIAFVRSFAGRSGWRRAHEVELATA